jgi:bifunctional non-homologous end joining protein LigD
LWGANKPPAKSARHLDAQEKAAAGRAAFGRWRDALCPHLLFRSFIEPCHPSERDRLPSGNPWVQEIKADGYGAQLLWA